MAQFPCDVCGSRYKGKQNTAYPAIINDDVQVRMLVRMCAECLDYAVSELEAAQARRDSLAVAIGCEIGLCANDAKNAIFFTYYAAGADRADAFGRACHAHTLELLPHLLGPDKLPGEATAGL